MNITICHTYLFMSTKHKYHFECITQTLHNAHGDCDRRRIASGTKHNKLHNIYKVNILKLLASLNIDSNVLEDT